ncbi:MAG TPA: metallophosphoesterase [Acetobacteraceae bacterium]|nr:metallophosphoesterase [Acetobacteraceae bacterium]
MAVFFTADTHFGHGGARALYRRPFESVAAMDAALVERWNAAVGPGDTVWHLGDVAWRPDPVRLAALLGTLNGIKHLIRGNNDGAATLRWPGWASVADYAETELDGTGLVLCHYPFRSWRNAHRGWWNLHGHSHGRLKPLPRQADVGVDTRDFRPVTLDQIMGARRRR